MATHSRRFLRADLAQQILARALTLQPEPEPELEHEPEPEPESEPTPGILVKETYNRGDQECVCLEPAQRPFTLEPGAEHEPSSPAVLDWRRSLPACGSGSSMRLQVLPRVDGATIALEEAPSPKSIIDPEASSPQPPTPPESRSMAAAAAAAAVGAGETLWCVGLRRGSDQGGFGVRLYHSARNQLVQIDSLEPDSTAAQAGLKQGDQVLAIAGVWLPGRIPQSLSEAMAATREIGSSCAIEWIYSSPRTSVGAMAEKLVKDGADMLNTARDEAGFRSALASFTSALEIMPGYEPAEYGLAQARKALEFAIGASSQAKSEGGSPHSMTKPASAGNTAESEPYSEGTTDGELPGGTTYVVVSEAKVRRGIERSSPMVRTLELGTAIEVLTTAADSNGLLRLRFAEGWASIQAANGTLLLEEVFSCANGDAVQVVCSGEKAVWKGSCSLRSPSGRGSWAHGVAFVTTKRLVWYEEPTAGDRPVGSGARETVAFPLMRCTHWSARGGGLGFGLAEGFDATVETLPLSWEGLVQAQAGRWTLGFGRRSGERDQLLKMLAEARRDCLRLEGKRTPHALGQRAQRAACKRELGTSTPKELTVAWLSETRTTAASLQPRIRAAAEGEKAEARRILRKAQVAVRGVRDRVFLNIGEMLRVTLFSTPGWDSDYGGADRIMREGWVRLMHVRNETWRRRYLVLRHDSLDWYRECEGPTSYPSGGGQLFEMAERLRLVDISELTVGASPLEIRVVSSGCDSIGGELVQLRGLLIAELETEREQDAADWIHSIWAAMESQKASHASHVAAATSPRTEAERQQELDEAELAVQRLAQQQQRDEVDAIEQLDRANSSESADDQKAVYCAVLVGSYHE
eukprot:SAG11_NODE_620_length_8171_cov_9.337339_3_plen_864_part_00